ncbi:MAG: hypothetical protein LC101_11315 [Flavobacteriales bacterium]|nr:hypothetical protein [Flavobacteriales bacterium]
MNEQDYLDVILAFDLVAHVLVALKVANEVTGLGDIANDGSGEDSRVT